MENAASEIAKLTERIAKDPKSKLFVSLAEEYKKAGNGEMAISVLREGLKNNPGYVTAKSSLGKLLFETGDLSGAKTEFEDVVKAVPDHIMAQKKLGDVYALQGRIPDALTHYKLVLSINPRDEETAALVSDLEAGRDIKARIATPKPVVGEGALSKKDTTAAGSAAAMNTTSGTGKPMTAKISPPSEKIASGEEEEAEEVLFVEPLEAPSGSLEDALSSENLGFMSDAETEPEETASAGQDLFGEAMPPTMESEADGVQTAEEGELWLEDTSSDVTPAETGKQADDFTTDTLAELYITQGFFEKAIEIYERLLLDNPDSQGLKDKLTKVKAMAAGTAPAKASEADTIELASPHEFITSQDTEADLSVGGELGFGEEFVPPSDQDITLSQPGSEETGFPGEGFKSEQAPGTEPPSATLDTAFEPVEYIPPDAVPRKQDEEEIAGKTVSQGPETKMPDAPKSSSARKETIDRLENWLHQIMKEK